MDLRVNNTANNGSWGVHGRILPYLEQGNVYEIVDLSLAWDGHNSIDGLKIPTFACPSDPGSDQIRTFNDGRPSLYPTNYGFNFGRWFVYDPTSRKGGDGMFYPNSFLGFRDCLDGTTNTLLLAEVKAWTPYRRNAGPPSTAIPQTIADAEAAIASGSEFKDTGHTEWPDGRVHHEGFTTTMVPNTQLACTNGTTSYTDCDYNSWQEGKNGRAGMPSYAIVTSRSYHTGAVQSVLMDGSARTISQNIDMGIWRALGTRGGGEVVGEF